MSELSSFELEVIDFMKQCDFLIPSEDYTLWHGVMENDGTCNPIVAHTPNFPSAKDAQVVTSSRVLNKLLFHLRGVNSPERFKDLVAVMVRVRAEMFYSDTRFTWDAAQMSFVKCVSKEINSSVGLSNMLDASPDFKEITLKYVDVLDNKHWLVLELGKDYPSKPPIIKYSGLPKAVEAGLGQVKSIEDAYTKFTGAVSNLLPLWEELEELSKSAWVTDPIKPTFKDWYRRVILSVSLSVLISFDPMDLTATPELKFIGSIDAVSKMRKTYEDNLKSVPWDPSTNICENIQRLCGVDTLPQKPEILREDENRCIICLCYYTDDELPPSKWCTNERCSSLYHLSCLSEWFKSIAATSLLYDYLSAPCPYCNEAIFIEKKYVAE